MLNQSRPITMAVLAMGGEGGGVLADWCIDMAEHSGYWAQTTSVPGVAQRTGATIYYLEFFAEDQSNKEPILSTMPTPGEVDIVIASELMEAGRAVFRGFVTPETTTFIASTNRVYSMTEKTAMGDGRVSSEELLSACEAAAKKFISGDFSDVADKSGTVISAALFGALAGSGALPFAKDQFTSAVERSGVGVKNSLIAFEKSFEIAQNSLKPKPNPVSISIGAKPADAPTANLGLTPAQELEILNNPNGAVGSKLQDLASRIKSDYPSAVTLMTISGIKRTADYQDAAYAKVYLDRLEAVKECDSVFGDGTYRTLNEVARYTALWMTYEDTIRVADLKTRRTRFNRVNDEARVGDNQIMQVREFLHPMAEEIADTLPTLLGGWIIKTKPARNFINKLTINGMRLHTTSLHGYFLLYILARLKFIRRRSLRFNLEQERIDQWLTKILAVMPENYDLAYEIAESANVIKGYGDTHKNGWRNFTSLMSEVDKLRESKDSTAATRISTLRSAALSDETGEKLRALL